MVCVALRFLASGIFLYSVDDAENLNKATICCTIRNVSLALKSLVHIFITFPGHRRFIHIKEEFYKIAAFPNVIGTVDCTHIRIQRPSGAHEGDYVNRKSFHSNVQMICDADCLITNLEAKWPGSVHDSRIFRASRIYQRLSRGEFSGVLLGDKGYACETFLMTPLTDPQTPAQQADNHAHAKTRARIEMTFSHLKSRFQCLHHLRVSPDRACDVTVACTVLHNIAWLRKERAPRVALDVDWDAAICCHIPR
ncbi:putative nuclease HARBI1 [Pimephales promelas]|nr:putative nuclease HARBI1 [Pimephales promelas]